MAADASLIISADIHGIICIFDGKLFDVDQGVSIWYFEVFDTLKYCVLQVKYWYFLESINQCPANDLI